MRRDGHIVASNWHVNMAPTIARERPAIQGRSAVLHSGEKLIWVDPTREILPGPLVVCWTHLLELVFAYQDCLHSGHYVYSGSLLQNRALHPWRRRCSAWPAIAGYSLELSSSIMQGLYCTLTPPSQECCAMSCCRSKSNSDTGKTLGSRQNPRGSAHSFCRWAPLNRLRLGRIVPCPLHIPSQLPSAYSDTISATGNMA